MNRQLDKPDTRPKLPKMVLSFRCSFCKEVSDIPIGGLMTCLSCERNLSLCDSVHCVPARR